MGVRRRRKNSHRKIVRLIAAGAIGRKIAGAMNYRSRLKIADAAVPNVAADLDAVVGRHVADDFDFDRAGNGVLRPSDYTAVRRRCN